MNQAFQRALAAFLAMARRFLGVRFAALALPPIFPPLRPALTAFGSLPFGSGSDRSAAASGSSLSSRLSNTRFAKRLGSLVGFLPMIRSVAQAGTND